MTKGLGTAKRGGVGHLYVHGSTPATRCLRSPEPAQPLREGFDHERQPIAFVAVIDTAGWQQRAGWVVEEHRRVIGRHTGRIERPRAREPLAFAFQPPRQAVRGNRRTDVDPDRIAIGRDADGKWVGGKHRFSSTERGHTRHRRVGTGNDYHQATIRRPL